MALKPLRPCRHPGCSQLVREGYCPAHKPKDRGQRSEEAQSWRWMYNTDEWTKDLRPTQLLHEPFCRKCAKRYPACDPRSRTLATDVDHIVDHKGDWGKFTDRNNLQSLCHSCHSRKTMADMHAKSNALRSRYRR
ncbi:HNH endonuclease signature motif containing protein [Oscillibacter valericigenes]|nr:HNH endonuclease signature motif containing protein [Oscillibacter valericigenes]